MLSNGRKIQFLTGLVYARAGYGQSEWGWPRGGSNKKKYGRTDGWIRRQELCNTMKIVEMESMLFKFFKNSLENTINKLECKILVRECEDDMDIQGISAMTQNQTNYGGQSQSSAASDSSSSEGWKYITVKEGDKVYTYLVIGKNMRILIGESSEEKTDDKDKKSADGTKDTNSGTGQTKAPGSDAAAGGVNAAATNGQKEQKEKQVDFLMDTSMLALTGYYQEQMRRTIKHLGDAVGNDSKTATTADAGQTR